MGWQDQGRQEHGWFGHGHGFAVTDGADLADRAELRARAKAAFEFAMERLRAATDAGWIPYRDMRDVLGELVPRWAEGAEAPPDTFRRRYFGDDANPVEAWGMQRVALAVRVADTHAKLKTAGADLSAAMMEVGLFSVHGFLQAAQKQALLHGTRDALPVQRIAERPEEEREEEEAAEKRLLPRLALTPPHVPSVEEPIGKGIMVPGIGGAAVFGGDKGPKGAPTGGREAGAKPSSPPTPGSALGSTNAETAPVATEKPPISPQKQNGHIAGTPQNQNRLKQGTLTSTFDGNAAEAEALTREAWNRGTPKDQRRPWIRDYDFGYRIGTGPKGGAQSIVRVHRDEVGKIHGHPAGPESP